MAWESSKPSAPILLGIAHRGQVSTAWAINLLRAISPYLPRLNIFTGQGHPIDVTREALVQAAIASKAEYIYFLDSDVYTQPGTLRRLLSLNVPIVTALYYRRHELPITEDVLSRLPEGIGQNLRTRLQIGLPIFTPAIWKDYITLSKTGENLRSFRAFFDGEFKQGQLVEADAIPMGCCLIKTEVFRKLPRPWFYWTFKRDPSMLKEDLSGNIQIRQGVYGCSEDLYFSLLARKHGYKLLCDTAALVRHESQVLIGSEGSISVVET